MFTHISVGILIGCAVFSYAATQRLCWANEPIPLRRLASAGGMVTSGIIGLFIGPLVLAVGYQLFWQWLQDRPQDGGGL